MTISASKVKELRDLSGAGMMDCKKALLETNGNISDAMDFLRKFIVRLKRRPVERLRTD